MVYALLFTHLLTRNQYYIKVFKTQIGNVEVGLQTRLLLKNREY